MADVLSRWDLDISRLRFATRTALACCVAVLVAWMLGLEHPQWSGMTVWIASQPMRGNLIEKSFFRLAGTVSGTLVGVAIALLAGWFVALRSSDELVANWIRHLSGHEALSTEVEHALLADIAALDDTLDPHGAGSLRSRRSVRAIRALLLHHVSLLLWLKSAAKDVPQSAGPHHLVVLHRDSVGARQAMIRAGGAMLLVGLLWWLTGWHGRSPPARHNSSC